MNLAAVSLLARLLYGISATDPGFAPDEPDVSGDIERVDDTTVAATVTLPSGDHYRIVVEWLGDREAVA